MGRGGKVGLLDFGGFRAGFFPSSSSMSIGIASSSSSSLAFWTSNLKENFDISSDYLIYAMLSARNYADEILIGTQKNLINSKIKRHCAMVLYSRKLMLESTFEHTHSRYVLGIKSVRKRRGDLFIYLCKLL